MNVLDALGNPYFQAYTLIAGGLLAAAGAVLWWRRRGPGADGPWRVYWSWVLFVGTVVSGVLLGHEAFVLLVALVALFGCREFARATGLYQDWLFTGLVYLAILAANGVALWAGLGGGLTRGVNRGYDLFLATPIYAVAALCVLPVVRNRSEGMLPRLALAVMGFVYFGYFLAHLSLLAGLPGTEGEVYAFVLFLLFGSATTGLATTMAGRWLGRRPIAPRISADTTWEGAAAGMAWALAWCLSVGWTLPRFGVWTLLLAAVVLGVLGLLGELVMRFALRDLSLRAQDEVRPVVPYLALGHLDRLIFAAPLFFRLVHLVYP